jgi:very-short-patch-repair endonuclease
MTDWLNKLKQGSALALLCSDVAASFATLKSDLAGRRFTVCSLQWADVEQTKSLIDEAVDGLARISLALWPNWPGGVQGECAPCDGHGSGRREGLDFPQEVAHSVTSRFQSASWREAANNLCRAARLPLPRDYPQSAQAAQLALTLTNGKLGIAMAIERIGSTDQIAMLRAAAEWLAASTGGSVILMVPSDENGIAELKKLIPWVEHPDAVHVQQREKEHARPLVGLFPITGAPHPLSPTEKRLAAKLRQDAELANLFSYNRRIAGHHGNQYIVDLIWQDGGLIVEIDGFQVHGNRSAFIQDRHRDYELMAAGYRVLRITDDEIVGDTQSAVEKIRQIVRYLKQSPVVTQGAASND